MERAERNLNSGSVRDFASQKAHGMKDSLHDVQEMVKHRSSELIDDSIRLVKRYPVSTALGAVAVGFIAGILLGGRR